MQTCRIELFSALYSRAEKSPSEHQNALKKSPYQFDPPTFFDDFMYFLQKLEKSPCDYLPDFPQ